MRLKQLFIWLVVLALAAAAYFISGETERRAQEAKDKADRLVKLEESAKVQRVELSGEQYPRPVMIERREKEHSWRILKPVDYPGDGLNIGRLIDAVLAARIKKRLQGPVKLADFGLKPPQVRLVLVPDKGEKVALIFGEVSPTKTHLYAAPADADGKDGIWMIPAKVRDDIVQTLFQLRDKLVLDFVINDVVRIEMDTGKGHFVLVRKKSGDDTKWRFADGTEADPEEVDTLLSRIHGLMAKDFVDSGIDMKKMGLEPAAGVVKLELDDKGKKTTIGLLVGAKAKTGDERYVRRSSGGPVMVVNQTSLAAIQMSRHRLTQRRPWRLERKKIVSIAIDRRKDGQKLVYVQNDDQWRRTQPPGGENSGTPASLFVWDLIDLKWEKILPPGGDYGLDHPQVVITITQRKGKAQGDKPAQTVKYRLLVGKKDPKSGLLAAQVQGQKRVLGIKPKFLENVPKLEKKKKQSAPKGD